MRQNLGHHHMPTNIATQFRLHGYDIGRCACNNTFRARARCRNRFGVYLGIPLMRSLFSKTRNATNSSSSYGSSTHTSLFSKKGGRVPDLDPTTTSSELMDDNDASSQSELQPINTSHIVRVSSVFDHHNQSSASSNHAIMVERRWEVRRD
jgi:hypothetical protein